MDVLDHEAHAKVATREGEDAGRIVRLDREETEGVVAGDHAGSRVFVSPLEVGQRVEADDEAGEPALPGRFPGPRRREDEEREEDGDGGAPQATTPTS
ncbi:MAG TPA: hypothetical protein VM889_05750 [Candidatus Thermoplasmatota archaeon]|nr:hypothetical protein [Candidatus Thermoplasmatota archaeon]